MVYDFKFMDLIHTLMSWRLLYSGRLSESSSRRRTQMLKASLRYLFHIPLVAFMNLSSCAVFFVNVFVTYEV
jgi:hypothetical protein